MTFTVQVEYGIGANVNVEATDRFWRDDKSYDFINSCMKGCD